MSRDWAHGAAVALPPHPLPVVGAVEVGLDDARMPRAPRQMAIAALGAGFAARITYAYGWTMLADGARGPLVESLACRMRHEDGRRAVAVWDAVERAVCPDCRSSLRPTAAGVFRVHGPTNARCAGGGAAAPPGRVLTEDERLRAAFSFDVAYAWHVGRVASLISVTALREEILDPVARLAKLMASVPGA